MTASAEEEESICDCEDCKSKGWSATPPSDAATQSLSQTLHSVEKLSNASAAPVSAWQDISTAPKDGTNFVAVYGDDFDGTFWILFWNNTCFECVSGGYQVDHATHWMPLPAPPISHNEGD